MKIPLIKADLPDFEAVKAQFEEILGNGKITNFGKYVTEFEEETGKYLGTQTATISSGTMGLVFTLQALGLKPGEKVILPSFTFMATAQAVLYAGGVPMFTEVGEDLTLSLDDLKKILEQRHDVSVVIPVHMYGLPCQVEPIEQIVKQASKRKGREIRVLYDAAHAFGASVNGRRVDFESKHGTHPTSSQNAKLRYRRKLQRSLTRAQR